MIEDIDLENAQKIIKKAMIKAGKKVKEGFLLERKGISFKDEEKRDIVTKYDLEAEKIIVDAINKKFPHHNILAEEVSSRDMNSDYIWLIDPIDGTRNFSRKISIFMIGVALAKGDNVIMCFSYNPINKEFYFAQKGKGAYLNKKRIRVSENKLRDSDVDLQIVKNNTLKKKIFTKLINESFSIRNHYSIIFSSTMVASGKIDALISLGAHPWDYCNYLLVEEAGGIACDFDGKKFDLSKNNLIVSNKKICPNLIKKLSDVKNG